jgi:Transglutaminase-like superfamily
MAERRHGPVDVLLALEAFAWLAAAALALRLVSFAVLARWASSRALAAAVGGTGARAAARRIGWAVAAAARRAPWPTACFDQGLACHAMLRRWGLASQLCYGARSQGSPGPEAHVWVRSGDVGLVGAQAAGAFALLAAFPPTEPSQRGQSVGQG